VLTAFFAAAVALTVALGQHPVQGTFTGGTTAPGNQVAAATNFCTTPGSDTVTADADSFIDQANPSAVSGGAATFLVVTAQPGAARRVLVRFPMPPVPSRCEVTTATLRIFAETQTAGRILGAYLADPAVPQWTEAGLSWSNQPAAVGSAATVVMPNSDQYVEWPVTTITRALYLGANNNGFVVRDQDETVPGAMQQLNSRSLATNKPQLYVAWG
jgi:hypothetical protein